MNLQLKSALRTKYIFILPEINLELKSALRTNIYFTKHQFTVKIGLKD